MTQQTFRAGAGAVIVDGAGGILAFDRADVSGPAWQLPQGGLDPGEEPEAAAFRELLEETGIPREQLELLGRIEEPLACELPPAMRTRKTGRGQVGYWFFFRVTGPEVEPQLPEKGEFRAWQVMDFEALLGATVEFRRSVYRRLMQHFEEVVRPGLG
jgi:putative (di)nucleoside polyphosphate hydrolase